MSIFQSVMPLIIKCDTPGWTPGHLMRFCHTSRALLRPRFDSGGPVNSKRNIDVAIRMQVVSIVISLLR